MAYLKTRRIITGGLAHLPIHIFMANFIKGKFGIITEGAEVTLAKEGKVEVIKELSNKLVSIEQRAIEV